MAVTSARVALDLTVCKYDRAGSGVYAEQLSTALRPLLGSRLIGLSFPLAARRRTNTHARNRLLTLTRDLWWTQWAVTRAAERRGAGLLHMPTGVGPVRCRLPVVVTIHDLAVLRFPERFRTWFRNYARFVLPRVAAQAAKILTVSEASRTDIIERLNQSPERVVAIPNGVSPAFRPRSEDPDEMTALRLRYKLPSRFAITVGSVEPRKNLVRLLHAVQALRSDAATSDVQLVHVGPQGWLNRDVAQTYRELGLESAVRFLGYVPAEDMPALYSLARLLVYPSLFEGFGLPVLEAMACGCPVVTSNASSLPEVAGNAAVLVDPTSSESIADGVRRVWIDTALREKLRKLGLDRATQFSWERAARKTARVYDSVLQSVEQ